MATPQKASSPEPSRPAALQLLLAETLTEQVLLSDTRLLTALLTPRVGGSLPTANFSDAPEPLWVLSDSGPSVTPAGVGVDSTV